MKLAEVLRVLSGSRLAPGAPLTLADGAPLALAGAFALNAYGLGRATADLDLVAPLSAQPLIVERLERAGFETLHRSDGFSNHLHGDPVYGRLDFIYVDAGTAERLFGAAKPVDLPGGGRVLLPKREHLIAMKVHAIRNDPSRRLKDLADIQFLLRGEGVDREEARGYFERAGLLHEWTEVIKGL